MTRKYVEEGEFKGWWVFDDEPFEYELVGPFHVKDDDQNVQCAFRAERRHLNAGGVVHGGCLMAFADFSLFAIAWPHMSDDAYGVTVAFTSEFLSGPPEGALITSHGEVLRAGGSLIFVRGLIEGDGTPCLSFSGTIKRIRKK